MAAAKKEVEETIAHLEETKSAVQTAEEVLSKHTGTATVEGEMTINA